MQRFKASITFWTMSLVVKTNKILYRFLRGCTNSSADGDSVGSTNSWMQPQAAAYQLMCCSSVPYGRGKSLFSAHVNRMQKKADLSAIRHSFFSCWNVAPASAWSSCLCCKATSLAATQCSCKGVIQRCYAAQLGLNKPRIYP